MMMMMLRTMRLSQKKNLLKRSTDTQKSESLKNKNKWNLWNPYLPTLMIPCRGKLQAERSKGVASGAEERVKPINAQRKEYGMKGAKNGYSTYLSAQALTQLSAVLLVGLSK